MNSKYIRVFGLLLISSSIILMDIVWFSPALVALGVVCIFYSPEHYQLVTYEKDVCINVDYLNKLVDVKIAQPLGSIDPEYGYIYPINYGYIKNTMAGNNENLDAYILGEFNPIEVHKGRVIAIIKRTTSNDEKLIVCNKDKKYTKDQIKALVEFRERDFDYTIIK
jgi:inorganic pyrophosphatase